MHAAVLADLVDGDDVGMVEASGGARLELEPPQVVGAQERVEREDLEGDAASEGHLLGLVDEAHAAAADRADDAEVTQLARPGAIEILPAAPAGLLLERAEVLEEEERGEDLADLLGQLGMPRRVLLDRGRLSTAMPLEELPGQAIDGIEDGAGVAHGSRALFPRSRASKALFSRWRLRT